MPELPEVETIIRELNRKVKNKTIVDVEINGPFIIRPQKPGLFKKIIKDSQVVKVARRGKLIIVSLSHDHYLLIHLKMTGQLVYNQKEKNKHTHIIFHFKDKNRLYYNDIRKFGFINVVDSAGLKEVIENRFKFGPEPLDKNFNHNVLGLKLARRVAPIKSLLLSQQVLAGLGNIYADESLFHANIHPKRKGGSLKPDELKTLSHSIQKILRKAIAAGGSSARNYRRTSGRKGSFQNFFYVYQRTGQSCLVCRTPISRIVIAGRSTHFCPSCQKIQP